MAIHDESEDAPAKLASDFPLVLALRVLGGTDMFAFVAVAMPTAWIHVAHQLSGLGELPAAPITFYLARSASALYALHGLMVVYMSFDVRRYWPLIRFLARLAIVHGIVMLCIDLAAGMPAWWSVLEGPAFAATGLIVLVAQYWVRPETDHEAAGA